MLFAGRLNELMFNESINTLLWKMDQNKYVIDRVFPGRFLRFPVDHHSIHDLHGKRSLRILQRQKH
ncbi:MAG: hypothetical protein A2Y62_05510 [Candidatus Fischerbacteria bacterium RBG_13_37_8]|uniref:Uncharacterized protein n=1 Tax=Candidatus Fischerbacteria bacterium RBG_13_37_8 TaxID=1817863 RepID=A0A1F5VYS7_9BACT|nr:MAG: hypothetical protein A2Y62_05510 [Candidatus Fischerbacteria bacterium RBG_13_37_8]